MRWSAIKKVDKSPKIGDFKSKKRFLILPVTCNGETRWLELVELIYEYRSNAVYKSLNLFPSDAWVLIGFIDQVSKQNTLQAFEKTFKQSLSGYTEP